MQVVVSLVWILLAPLLASQEQVFPRLLSVPPAWTESSTCGRASSLTERESKILGGQVSTPGRWPWQVSIRLRWKYSNSSVHRHGGALLSGSWVVTAAHPVSALSATVLSVVVGAHNLSSSSSEEQVRQERHVKGIHVHPAFDPVTFEADVALLELEDPPVEMSGRVGTICLPMHRTRPNRTAVISGWGATKIGGPTSDVLRWVSVPLVNRLSCQEAFRASGFQEDLGDAFLCAGQKNKDACQGDSGGPLAEEWSSGRWQLVGLVSWGIGCGDLPGVHVNVSHYITWIMNTIEKYEEEKQHLSQHSWNKHLVERKHSVDGV